MTHAGNIDSIQENIFILLNLCYAGKQFAERHDLESYEGKELIDGEYYSTWLHFMLSEKLLEIAINTRVVMDLIISDIKSSKRAFPNTPDDYFPDLNELEKEISGSYLIGHFHNSKKRLSLRESCNKIIHAEEIMPVFKKLTLNENGNELSSEARKQKFWTGTLDLSGEHNKKEWNVRLELSEFCFALEDFCRQVSGEDYLGVWDSIYKYSSGWY